MESLLPRPWEEAGKRCLAREGVSPMGKGLLTAEEVIQRDLDLERALEMVGSSPGNWLRSIGARDRNQPSRGGREGEG